MAARAYIGIGSNLGDRRAQAERAVEHMNALPGTRVRRTASWYESEPWGPSERWFVNGVAELDTDLTAEQLLQALLAIEEALGRQRQPGERWRPRPIDLDVLLFDDTVIDSPTLVVPHPELHRRRFVLQPLAELAATVTHPRLGLTIAVLLANLADDKRVVPLSSDA